MPTLIRFDHALPPPDIAAVQVNVINHVQNALTLFDAAVFEGAAAGIDIGAAPAALSWARRASLHALALGATPLLGATSPQVLAAMARADCAAATWAQAASDLLATTEDLGQPKARATRAARRRIAVVAARTLPDMRRPLEDLRHTLEGAARAGLDTADTVDTVSTRLAHLTRLADLLPRLHHALVKTCGPNSAAEERDLRRQRRSAFTIATRIFRPRRHGAPRCPERFPPLASNRQVRARQESRADGSSDGLHDWTEYAPRTPTNRALGCLHAGNRLRGPTDQLRRFQRPATRRRRRRRRRRPRHSRWLSPGASGRDQR